MILLAIWCSCCLFRATFSSVGSTGALGKMHRLLQGKHHAAKLCVTSATAAYCIVDRREPCKERNAPKLSAIAGTAVKSTASQPPSPSIIPARKAPSALSDNKNTRCAVIEDSVLHRGNDRVSKHKGH